MLTIYHLEASRSSRVIWLAEELGLEYKLEIFKRTPQGGAPPEYKALHALGRAPTVRDGDQTIAESGAIVEYLLTKYGKGRLVPDASSPAFAQYLEWLHLSEGTLMANFVLAYFMDMAGLKDNPMRHSAVARFGTDITYADSVLAKQPYLAGNDFTAADIMNSYGLMAAGRFEGLPPHPHVQAYVARLNERPAFQKAQSFG